MNCAARRRRRRRHESTAQTNQILLQIRRVFNLILKSVSTVSVRISVDQNGGGHALSSQRNIIRSPRRKTVQLQLSTHYPFYANQANILVGWNVFCSCLESIS